jgi:hypothetical protein
MADLHNYATCNSNIQPVGKPNTCNKKRDLSGEELITPARSRILGRAYGDVSTASWQHLCHQKDPNDPVTERCGHSKSLRCIPQPQHRQQDVGQVP